MLRCYSGRPCDLSGEHWTHVVHTDSSNLFISLSGDEAADAADVITLYVVLFVRFKILL